jgi:hypothetical protein
VFVPSSESTDLLRDGQNSNLPQTSGNLTKISRIHESSPIFSSDGWLKEIAACLVSIASAVAIFVLLLSYDHKPIPSFSHDVTLNGIIAALTILMESMLLVPVSAAVGQLKWNWFASQYRPMGGLDAFDDVSRGPWGSVKMLFSLKAPQRIVSIGALITVLAVAIDASVQQAAQYPVRQIPGNENATIGVSLDGFSPANDEIDSRKLRSSSLSTQFACIYILVY